MLPSTRLEDYQFEARVLITCCCGRFLTIGPNAISGDCWRCGRIYMTQVQVMEREPTDV